MDNRSYRHGAGRADIVTVVCFTALLILLVLALMPQHHRRESSNRSVCAANLRGIMQSLNVYAADNADAYPIIAPIGRYALAADSAGTPQPTAEATLQSIYADPRLPSITQNMWLLVLTGQVAPKQFICKSDPVYLSTNVIASATYKNLYQTNFNDGNGKPSDFAYSYSFAYPWQTGDNPKVGDWWKNTTDASLPLMSDIAPVDATGTPASTPADPTSRNANSVNHNRDGQNVGYGDAHAEFARTPAIGQHDDNIFTFNGGIPSKAGTPHTGTVPNLGTGGTLGAFDLCLVPAADSTNHARH